MTAPASLEESGNDLYVRLDLTVDDEDGLRDLLKDGASLQLAVTLELQRRRSWWMDADVISRTYTSALQHDPLTREFLLSSPVELGHGAMLKDRNLTRLLHSSWRQLSLYLTSRDTLRSAGQEHSDYRIVVSYSLQHTEVPPWLEKSPLFWSSEVVPTERITLEYP